ncbi:MAG TPA: ribbon-helix-helix protein, CopG family [Chloroflexota bacterium]
MQRTNIYLTEDQLRALKHLAAEDKESVATLVREAVSGYLARRLTDDTDWDRRLEALLDRMRRQTPEGVSSSEIEADISAAREEVRLERRARRS